MKQAKPVFDDARATFWRTLQTFAFTRTLIVAVLLVYFSLSEAKLWPDRQQFWEACLVYLLLALLFVLSSLYWRRRFMLQLVLQIALDIGAISFLYLSAGGIKSGLAILYLFPLAGGAILAPLVLALFFVSAVTLILLAENGYQLLNAGADISSSQVGLYCAAFFIVIFAINRLAARLIKQESLALGRGKALHVQQAINRLIIADMEDGILVVDRRGRVLTSNPAAARMLGLTFPHEKAYGKLSDMAWLRPIADAYLAWDAKAGLRATTQANVPTFVLIKQTDDTTLQGGTTVMGGRRELITHLKLRFAKVDADGVLEDRVVIFLQDVTEIENRAQQLKLASMGRLTASIAHEVRNPLSAIGHAASLLSEEEPDAGRQRLLTIISENVARLNRMIEDILKLSRKAHQYHEPLCLGLLFDDVLAELHEMHAVKEGMIAISDMAPHKVRFDPLHLREIVLNLLTNALRYASGAAGSIRVYIVPGIGHRLELHVQDDGPQIKSAVRAHLFEPFYTTSSKGTGLGLYLARELCLNNGAMLNYEYRTDDEKNLPAGRFVITFGNNENI
ncbi:ATP-binding protein [Herminiimonas fonticola]|uniref:two-component system sensor histidine kinase NtrB n=1 Tax=Herminiimonas fonticola TaxID=303380 RepID=UPI00333F991B